METYKIINIPGRRAFYGEWHVYWKGPRYVADGDAPAASHVDTLIVTTLCKKVENRIIKNLIIKSIPL